VYLISTLSPCEVKHRLWLKHTAQDFTPTFSFEPSPVQILPPLHTHDQQGQMFQHDAPLPMSFQPPPTFTHYVSHSHFHPYRPSKLP